MLPFPQAKETAIRFVNDMQSFKLLNDNILCETLIRWNVDQGVLLPEQLQPCSGRSGRTQPGWPRLGNVRGSWGRPSAIFCGRQPDPVRRDHRIYVCSTGN